jgi:mono/diheme cytochrome c family protein
VASASNDERRKEKRSTIAIAALMTVVFAFSISAAIIVSIHNARDAPRNGPDGIKLTADEATGRALFAKTCATCHTLAAVNAVARIGPDLDVLRPSKEKVLYALAHGFSGPGGQMPIGLYAGKDASDIASFVAAVAGR